MARAPPPTAAPTWAGGWTTPIVSGCSSRGWFWRFPELAAPLPEEPASSSAFPPSPFLATAAASCTGLPPTKPLRTPAQSCTPLAGTDNHVTYGDGSRDPSRIDSSCEGLPPLVTLDIIGHEVRGRGKLGGSWGGSCRARHALHRLTLPVRKGPHGSASQHSGPGALLFSPPASQDDRCANQSKAMQNNATNPRQMAHGVIESSAQLAYTYSFGALNEATADVLSGAPGLPWTPPTAVSHRQRAACLAPATTPALTLHSPCHKTCSVRPGLCPRKRQHHAPGELLSGRADVLPLLSPALHPVNGQPSG